MDIEKVKEALKWALENGVHPSYNHKTFYDYGCGCCAGTVVPPDDLKPIIYEVLGWT